MTSTTSKSHIFVGVLRVFLTLCASGMLLFQAAFSQEQQRTPQSKGLPVTSVSNRLVIAPATASIPDASALIQALLPHSVPPESLVVVLHDKTGVRVRNLEWDSHYMQLSAAKQLPKGIKWCDCGSSLGRHLCPESWSCADCCSVIKKAFESRTLSPEQSSEIDAILREVGLQRVSNDDNKKKTYPIAFNLFGADPKPEQTITCMNKDAKGNCTHWRICGTTTSGTYRCYDVVKDPVFGWVVTW